MRIAYGPRLRIVRTGDAVRRWAGRFWPSSYRYEKVLAGRRAAIRRMHSAPVADKKSPSRTTQSLQAGQTYRLIDGHGREFGKRLTASSDTRSGKVQRIRLVDRQEESLCSQFSRLLKAAYAQR